MDTKILNIARTEWKKLQKKYDGFNIIIIDDWRGFRFIFDTDAVINCKNDCDNCPVFRALKKETESVLFSPDLLLANKNDKKLFGSQNFLNCKTLNQYKACFASFLSQPNLSEKEAIEELQLIQNLEILFSRKGNEAEIKRVFLDEVLNKIPAEKRLFMQRMLKKI